MIVMYHKFGYELNGEKHQIDATMVCAYLDSFDMFKSNENNLHAWDIPTRAINLPSYHDLTFDDQVRVINVIKETIQVSQA